MLDGKPYDKTWDATTASASLPDTTIPYTAEISLPALSHFHVEWEDPNGLGQFVPITAGSLTLPFDNPRMIKPGSMMRIGCYGRFTIQFILTVDGGELTACAD